MTDENPKKEFPRAARPKDADRLAPFYVNASDQMAAITAKIKELFNMPKTAIMIDG